MQRKEVIEQLKAFESRMCNTELYMHVYAREISAVRDAIKLLEAPVKLQVKRVNSKNNKVYSIEMDMCKLLSTSDGNIAVWRSKETAVAALQYYKTLFGCNRDVVSWHTVCGQLDDNGCLRGRPIVYMD